MKVLDVIGTGVKAVARTVIASASSPVNRAAADERRRRAEVNAAAERRRAEAGRQIFGDGGRWLSPRPGWLDRRR